MSTPLDSRFIFDRFVVGSGNRVAAGAALHAAEAPGRRYNPLLIAGPSGVGKTHLLMAIGQRARVLDPEMVVYFESGDDFVDRVTSSLGDGTLDALRGAAAGIDLFLLDGLEQVAGKGRTGEELHWLISGLVGRGAQVVVSAGAAPAEIPGLDPGVVESLRGGLHVEIGAPEDDTRLAIVERLVAEQGYDLAGPVQAALARRPVEDVRELQRAVSHVVAAAGLENRPATIVDVQRLDAEPIVAPDAGGDEFDTFLTDISTAVAAVVETAPWRRRLAAAILRWEGEGIRTRRLEAALDADSAPDIEALLTAFGRDVGRLRRIARDLPADAGLDPLLLRDPDRLPEAERLLAEATAAKGGPLLTDAAPVPAKTGAPVQSRPIDRWFLDREKLAWEWLALDDRLVEEQR